MTSLPNERQEIVQGQTGSVADRIWYRWFRFIDRVVRWITSSASIASYAQIAGTGIIPPTVDATWRPIDNYAVDDFTPKGITTNLTNGTMSFDFDGIYLATFQSNMTHNESNQGRTFSLRLFNVTDSIPNPVVTFWAIGRNQPGSNISLAAMFEVTEANKNKEFRIEISANATITVTGDTTVFGAHKVSEWRDNIPPQL